MGPKEKEESAIGTPNHVYDAVSVLYHSLQAASQYEEYIADAQAAGDQELASFFRRIQEEDAARSEDLKRLINTRLVASA